MADGQRGEVRVGNEIARKLVSVDQLAQDLGMTVGRGWCPGRGRSKPALDLSPCDPRSKRLSSRPRVSRDPEEGSQALPGKPHTAGSVENILEPGARRLVETTAAIASVEKQVGID